MTAGEDLLARFAWIDGHADVWRLTAAPAEPFVDVGVRKVAGFEARLRRVHRLVRADELGSSA